MWGKKCPCADYTHNWRENVVLGYKNFKVLILTFVPNFIYVILYSFTYRGLPKFYKLQTLQTLVTVQDVPFTFSKCVLRNVSFH